MSSILQLVESHERWRGSCLNLMASENVTSPAARRILGSDLGHRYTLPVFQTWDGDFIENAYRGTRYLDAVEEEGETLACQVFRATHASLKPLGGHGAGMALLLAACRRGDAVMALSPDHGGYNGYVAGYMPEFLGLEAILAPADPDRMTIDAGAAADVIRGKRPRLVIAGQSVFPFPVDLGPLAAACKETGALLAYDGSHVLGLLAGGRFQDPLREGCSAVVASTHKSFFGPQGGLLLSVDTGLFERMEANMVWRTIDNAHWHRIGALAHALAEAKRFGPEYAAQVIANAKALARGLDERGLPVRFAGRGYTESHQVLLDARRLKDSWHLSTNDLANRLERENIIVDAIGRIGTSEATRLGMKEEEMDKVAELLVQAAKGEEVRAQVADLRGKRAVHFALPEA